MLNGHDKHDRISGGKISVLVVCAVIINEPRLGQTKDYKNRIFASPLSTQH
jgi:hypothetical protein